jgi:hypothetical protein
MPASPRGSREDLDDLGITVSERVEKIKSLKDPGVVHARVNMSRVGCPADAADCPGELEFAVASGLPVGRVRARAVDGHDGRPVLVDDVNDLPARQVALKRQNLAIVDDRDVEALSLSAHINADPYSHASQDGLLRCPSAVMTANDDTALLMQCVSRYYWRVTAAPAIGPTRMHWVSSCSDLP